MFVTGCHRSGTSLVAAILAALLPESQLEQRSIASGLDNPAGFYESEQLVAANVRLLAALGADWAHPPLLPVGWSDPVHWDLLMALRDQFASLALQRAWVDKDPRLAITAPAYSHILLRRVGLVAVLRDPLEVAQSLHARDGMPLQKGLLLWAVYNNQLAQQLQPQDLVIPYGRLLAGDDPAGLEAAVAAYLQQQAGVVLAEGQWPAVLAQQIRPQLRRSQLEADEAQQRGLDGALLACCRVLYAQVCGAGWLEGAAAFAAVFGGLPAPVLAALAREGWQGWPLGHLDPQEEQCRDQLAWAQQRVRALEGSSSWRLSAPLRWWGRGFSGR